MHSKAPVLVTLLVMLCNPQLFADLITNGSFEQPPIAVETRFFNGQTIGAGWSVISGDTAFIIPNLAGQGSSPFGSQFLEIHGDIVGQSVAGLIAGNEYILSYYATIRTDSNYFGTGQITASIAGQNDVFSYTVNGTNSYGSSALPWTLRTLNFTATSSTEMLTFAGSGAANLNPLAAIDNVTLTAVPEPGSLLMSAFAVLLLSRKSCAKRKE